MSLLNRRFGGRVCEGGRFTSVEAWRVCQSLLNESLNANGMLFEPYFEHSLKWTNLVFQLLNSPSVKKKYWSCGQSTYCLWFCSDNLHCWVLPGMGLCHQQFFKTIFGFGNMWQLRIWYVDIDGLRATNELVFNMLLRVCMLEEKHWTAQRQLETLFINVAASHSLVPNQIFLRKKHSVAKKWSWEKCLHVLSFPNSGNSLQLKE